MSIETSQFNSFRISTVEKNTDIVSLLLSADIHSKNSARQEALYRLYPDLLQAGSGEYNRNDFLYEVSSLGAIIEASVSEGRVMISLEVLRENLAKVLKLLEIMLLKPTFSAEELKRAKQKTANDLVLCKENARLLASDNLKRALFGEEDRKYRFLPELVSAEIEGINTEDLKNMHEVFLKSFWTIGLGGNNSSIKTVVSAIKKIKAPEFEMQTPVSAPKTLKNSSLLVLNVPSKQNIELSIGAPLFLKFGERDLAVFNFGLAVLGKWGGFAGRLMSTVRAKEGLTYLIYAKTEGVGREETGFWRILTFFSVKDIETGITSTLREINKICKTGITEAELKSFRTILKTAEKLPKDSLTGMVTLAHSLSVLNIEYSEYEKYCEEMYTCSRAEINKVLKQYLDPSKIVFSLAGPVANLKIKNLEKIIKA